ncbi:ICE family protease p20 domain-containing protein, putative [Babesia ovis]|uniref:ICE family protease p20 domain-containing protein, putative n=1 Tax=Babesia ovis TaxID=5869 RepID=A0A9W5TB54_BABOV|nr:ICE family protease p20 domain-containing protein, putative [Babesia ovis]
MNGVTEENSQAPASQINAAGGQQDSVQVLKTTKFVNVANLADYLSSMSGPNCRVVVQQVEQGSAIAQQLDRALADMQRRKAAAANGETPAPSTVIPQHPAPINTTAHNVQMRSKTETLTSQPVPVKELHHTTAVLQQGYSADVRVSAGRTTSVVQRSCETYSASHMTQVNTESPEQLKHRVSSLLMQLKSINITPSSSAEGNMMDRGQQPTVDTYDSFNDGNGKGAQKSAKIDSEKAISESSSTVADEKQEESHSQVEMGAAFPQVQCEENNCKPEPTFGELPATQNVQKLVMEQCEENSQAQVPFLGGAQQFVECVVPQDVDHGTFENNEMRHTPRQLPPEAYTEDVGETKLVRRFATKMHPETSLVAKERIGPFVSAGTNTPVAQSLNATMPSTPHDVATHSTRSILAPKVGPRRKAVVVGCSYAGNPNASLRGPCNDAMLFASALITHMGFDAEDILLLVDTEPASVYIQQLVALASAQGPIGTQPRGTAGRQKTGIIGGMIGGLFGDLLQRAPADSDLDVPEMLMLDSPGNPVAPDNLPTRSNILKALRWMVNGLRPGDSAVFYFSGHAVQTDDMSGWEGEGYDEALVPCDFMQHGDPSRGLIPAQQVRQLIQSVGRSCQVTVVLDTVGMQTALDPAGRTGPWRYIKGAMLRGIWPLADATGKMQRATYDPDVWNNATMQQQLVLPKFLPMMQVECAAALVDGFISSNMESKSSNSICIAAAPFEDVAVEALFRPMSLVDRPIVRVTAQGCEQVVCHGVFTYCLVATLLRDRTSKRGGITVRELVAGIQQRCQYLRSTRLPKIRQMCEATIHPAGLASLDNFFLAPWGGRVLPERIRRPGMEKSCKRLSAGLAAFLTLPDAWMQLHNEGRMRAAEHREKFGRMRSAVVNGSRMVTADLRQMALQQQQQGYVSRRPTSSIMIGHVPAQQRSVAGQSWCGQPQMNPQFMAHDFNMPQHCVYPMQQQPVVPVTPIHPGNHYHPMAQEYVVDQYGMMYPAHHVAQQWQGEYHVAEPMPQFGGCHQQQQPVVPVAFPQNVQNVHPPRQQQVCRSSTSAMFERAYQAHPQVGRNSTAACRSMGMKLAEPITSTMLSQLPMQPAYI